MDRYIKQYMRWLVVKKHVQTLQGNRHMRYTTLIQLFRECLSLFRPVSTSWKLFELAFYPRSRKGTNSIYNERPTRIVDITTRLTTLERRASNNSISRIHSEWGEREREMEGGMNHREEVKRENWVAKGWWWTVWCSAFLEYRGNTMVVQCSFASFEHSGAGDRILRRTYGEIVET